MANRYQDDGFGNEVPVDGSNGVQTKEQAEQAPVKTGAQINSYARISRATSKAVNAAKDAGVHGYRLGHIAAAASEDAFLDEMADAAMNEWGALGAHLTRQAEENAERERKDEETRQRRNAAARDKRAEQRKADQRREQKRESARRRRADGRTT